MQVNSGMMAPQDFVNAVSTAVARTFNLYPRKGVIAAGSDADVIIFDPKLRHTISAATHHSAVDTNVHEGWSGVGKVRTEAFTPLHIVRFCNVPMYACHRSLPRQALAGHNAAATKDAGTATTAECGMAGCKHLHRARGFCIEVNTAMCAGDHYHQQGALSVA